MCACVCVNNFFLDSPFASLRKLPITKVHGTTCKGKVLIGGVVGGWSCSVGMSWCGWWVEL